MLKKYLLLIAVTVAFNSCTTLQDKINNLKEASSKNEKNKNAGTDNQYKETKLTTIPKSKGDPDAANWDIVALDTARSVNYLTEVEKDVILETNKVRTDPQKYAELYIKPLYRFYKGKEFVEGNSIPIITQEGVRAAEECYAALKKAIPSRILSPERGLSLAALDHVKDQSISGATGHTGKDGSSPSTRTQRYGRGAMIGENIAYGPSTGRKIITDLLIDDGVPSRGHRKNILLKDFSQTGLSIGSHKQYRTVCVINYADGYASK